MSDGDAAASASRSEAFVPDISAEHAAHALALVLEREPRTLTELAEAVGVSAIDTSALIAGLERHDLLAWDVGRSGLRAGSAALDLCNVASGRYDGFWEFNLNPWDTAAGVLIVEEAGGKVTRFDGSPFELNSRETVASNGLLHEALLVEFQEIFAGRGMEPLPDPREYKR